MLFPLSYKTVFVLDHSPHFSGSSDSVIDYDLGTKNRTPGVIPLAPISKSLWTCSVESVLEYCRIVYDIFPHRKYISVLASDKTATVLNTWERSKQNSQTILEAMAKLGAPSDPSVSQSECDIMYGVSEAIGVLTMCADEQNEVNTSETDGKVNNRGRVICITALETDEQVQSIISSFQDVLAQQNKAASSSNSLLPLQECELVLLNSHSAKSETKVQSRFLHRISPEFSCEVGSYVGGKPLAWKLVSLVQRHYGLATTTITGIPMKEEQNAGSSANYDVEILHSREAHMEIHCLEKVYGQTDSFAGSTSQGASEKGNAVLLKWCQPRPNAGELIHCTGAYRISPADVNSRPSLCLTNFLLNGRQVMLEQPRKTGVKMVSYMLASHGGEIYLHCLSTGRSPLEDPPSISEGTGGRVTDYRITDFSAFMKSNRLTPCDEPGEEGEQLPLEKGKAQLERMTRHWPMVISETIIFNIPIYINTLTNLIFKPTLTEEDRLECKKVIYNLVRMETKNEALLVYNVGNSRKSNKRDEQYRQMWTELETFVRSTVDLSPGHEDILRCLQTCRKPDPNDPRSSSDGMEVDSDTPLSTIKRTKETTSLEPASGNTFSPESPPPCKKPNIQFTGNFGKITGSGQSLLTMWNKQLNSIHSKRHKEFAGRAESFGDVAKLYPNLDFEKNNGRGPPIKGSIPTKKGPNIK